ncbi:hypothetical protein GBA52_013736, partial [Prunus armeniaca]
MYNFSPHYHGRRAHVRLILAKSVWYIYLGQGPSRFVLSEGRVPIESSKIRVFFAKRVWFACTLVSLIFHLEMPFFHLRLTASHSTLNHVPLFGYVVEPTHFPQNTQHLNYHLPVLKNWPPLYTFVHPFPRFHSLGNMHISADMAEKFDILNVCHSILGMNSYEKQSSIGEVQSMHHTDSPDSISKEEKERRRRKKIGLANKGRVPWNKGRKHSSETCERIKQRTIEALKDPK